MNSVDQMTREQVEGLLDTALRIGRLQGEGSAATMLRGRNFGMIDEPRNTPTLVAGDAAESLGARVARVRLGEATPESELEATARVMGRLYDGLDCGSLPQRSVQIIERHALIPVFDGLDRPDHPARVLGDLLCLRRHGLQAGMTLRVRTPQGRVTPRARVLQQAAALTGLIVDAGHSEERSSTAAREPVTTGFQVDIDANDDCSLCGPDGAIPTASRRACHRLIVQALLVEALTPSG